MLEFIDFYIEPRQNGKTTRIINDARCLENHKRGLIVTHNQQHADFIDNMVNKQNIIVVSQSGLEKYFTTVFDMVWLDEYLFYKGSIMGYINDRIDRVTKRVCVRTSKEKDFCTDVYNLVQSLRRLFKKGKFVSIDSDDIEMDFFYLYTNLLTHPKTNLIKTTYYNVQEEFIF